MSESTRAPAADKAPPATRQLAAEPAAREYGVANNLAIARGHAAGSGGLPLSNQQEIQLRRERGAGNSAGERAADPAEREADQVADGALATHDAGAQLHGTRGESAGGARGGAPLDRATRGFFESRLGHDLGAVRVHTDSATVRTARSLDAQAYTVGADVGFGAGRYDPHSAAGRQLLGHELVHVIQQGAVPAIAEGAGALVRESSRGRVQRGPGDGSGGSGDDGSGGQGLPPVPEGDKKAAPPPKVVAELLVGLPPIGGVSEPPVKLAFEYPTTVQGAVTVSAVPDSELFETAAAAKLPKGKKRDEQSLARVPVAGGQADPAPAVVAPPPTAAPPQPAAVQHLHTSEGPIEIVARVDGYGITYAQTKLAVGAASTTVVTTPTGVMIVDAGLHQVGGNVDPAMVKATMARLETLVGEGPISEILLSHVHLDHAGLLEAIAGRWEIGSIRMSAAQALDPRWEKLKPAIAEAQRKLLEDKLREKAEARRAEWEAEHYVPEKGARDVQFKSWVEGEVKAGMAARRILDVQALVPSAEGLRIHEASIEKLEITAPEKPQKITENLEEPGRVTIVDPKLGEVIAEQKANPGKELADPRLDKYGASYIMQTAAGNRMLVLPDLRAADFERIRGALAKATAKLGKPVTFQTWDITHHLQAGFTDSAKRASELVGVTELLKQFTAVPTQSGGVSADLVVVSAHSPNIDPATAWMLRSIGMEIYVAHNAKDVRIVEAVTSKGTKVSGVAGGSALDLPGPNDLLMRKTHAAIEELRTQATDLRQRAKLLRKKADQARKQQMKDQADAIDKRIESIEKMQQRYAEVVNERLTRSPNDGKKPPSPEDYAAVEEASKPLRTEVAEFTKPVVGKLGTFSEVALVLLKNPGGPEGADAKDLADLQRRADELRTKLAEDTTAAETRAELVSVLDQQRLLLKRHEATATDVDKTVISDELAVLDGEIHTQMSATAAQGGDAIKTRAAGTGELVETRVVAAGQPADGAKPKSEAAKLVEKHLERAGKVLGAVMVYQTFKGQADLQKRFEAGDLNALSWAVGTTHNALGLSVGVRMVRGIHVGMGEFVVLSVLDFVQTATADYESSAERNTEIVYSGVRNALTLGMTVVGSALIETGNPIAMLAGFGLMFVVDPILDKLGVHDWLERKFSFMPDSVVSLNQKLPKLIKEYSAIVGDIELERRRLNGGDGVTPDHPKEYQDQIIISLEEHLHSAADLEDSVLDAFKSAYEEAKTSYAGLPELDSLRAQFLALQARAYGKDLAAAEKSTHAERAKAWKQVGKMMGLSEEAIASYDTEGLPDEKLFGSGSRDKTRKVFDAIEANMSIDNLESGDVSNMPQWTKLDNWLDECDGLLAKDKPEDIAWDDVSSKMVEISQMMTNARYRLTPSKFGTERATPMMKEYTNAGVTYENELRVREARLAILQRHINEAAAGKKITQQGDADTEADTLAEAIRVGDEPQASMFRTALGQAETALDTYKDLVDHPPEELPPELTVEQIYKHSADAGAHYKQFVASHEKYKNGLLRMKSTETAMQIMIGQAQAARAGSDGITEQEDERLAKLGPRAQVVIADRKAGKGLLYLDEAAALVPTIRVEENRQLAPVLGQPKDVKALTENEMAAAADDTLKDQHLTTIENRLAVIKELKVPTKAELAAGASHAVEGIYRVVGTFDQNDLLIVSWGGTTFTEADNVLVANVGYAGNTMTGEHGHTDNYYVIPLNQAAVTKFGGVGRQRLPGHVLTSITVEDLQAK